MAWITLRRLEAGGKFNVQPQRLPEAGAAGDKPKNYKPTAHWEGSYRSVAPYMCSSSNLTPYKQIKPILA